MIDDGENDEKIIAIPFNDPTYNFCMTLNDLPSHIFDEIQHFFSVYKTLEHKETTVEKVLGDEEAKDVIKRAIENYNEKFEK